MTARNSGRDLIAFVASVLLLALTAAPLSARIVITEIMYNPRGSEETLEFIELYNDSPTTQSLGGWQFTDGVQHTFPAGVIIRPHGYLVVCADPGAARTAYRLTAETLGPYEGNLDNGGETVALRNAAGGLIDEVDYDDELPWPVVADGTGHSLSLLDVLYKGESDQTWLASPEINGTPGGPNFPGGPPLPSPVVINEVYPAGGDSWIELFNPTNVPIDVSDWWISDDAGALDRFVIPNGLWIPAGGFRSLAVEALDLDRDKGQIFLSPPGGERVLHAVSYEDVPEGFSTGRFPDGAKGAFAYMSEPTPQAANRLVLNESIVINEIMYHSFSDRPEEEYIEIYNCGSDPVDLSGWAFTDGIDFEFPEGTTIQPGTYLVIAADAVYIQEMYAIINCVGNFNGRLANDGERLVLRDADGNIADAVTYFDGGRWPKWADGGGSSLELIDPRQANDAPAAWAASDEREKSEWVHIEYTKPHGDGRSEFQLFLADDGEMLIDDIELRAAGSENRIPNGELTNSADGWECGGTHKYSSWFWDARNEDGCLRVVAVGRGNTDINSIKTETAWLMSGRPYKVSYRARWQAGTNVLTTRTHGGGCAETTSIAVPEQLGTPGRRNSRYQENAGPVISALSHSPAVPKPAEPIHVSAEITDADGVLSAIALYRIDGQSNWHRRRLADDGRHNDGAADDGLFGAWLPGATAGTLIEFQLEVVDTEGHMQRSPAGAPDHTALVFVATPGGATSPVKRFRLLMTSRTWDEMIERAESQARMDNELLDATLVVEDSLVFYNVGIRFVGSPWSRPAHLPIFALDFAARRPSFRVRFNEDERFCGFRSINLDGQRQDPSLVRDRTFDWLAAQLGGVPTTRREYVEMSRNAVPLGTYEWVERVDNEFIEKHYPKGDDGNLYEANDAFDWRGRLFRHRAAQIEYRGQDEEEYRFNFSKRSNEKADDFSDLIELFRMLDPEETSDARMEAWVEANIDMDEWLRCLACVAVVADWDALGMVRGKNAYLYRRSDTGRWVMLPWDRDMSMHFWGLPVFHLKTKGLYRLLQHPPYRERYLQYIQQLVEGPFRLEALNPRFEQLRAVAESTGDEMTGFFNLRQFVEYRRKYLKDKVLADSPSKDAVGETGAGPGME